VSKTRFRVSQNDKWASTRNMKKRERVSSRYAPQTQPASIQRNSLSGTRPSNTSLSVRQLIFYYFESALSPNVVWVNLNKIDFSPGSGIRSVAVESDAGHDLIGNSDAAFKPVKNIAYIAP
jgi:penicillin V acylase-like amidase (Ntn superfamily)